MDSTVIVVVVAVHKNTIVVMIGVQGSSRRIVLEDLMKLIVFWAELRNILSNGAFASDASASVLEPFICLTEGILDIADTRHHCVGVSILDNTSIIDDSCNITSNGDLGPSMAITTIQVVVTFGSQPVHEDRLGRVVGSLWHSIIVPTILSSPWLGCRLVVIIVAFGGAENVLAVVGIHLHLDVIVTEPKKAVVVK